MASPIIDEIRRAFLEAPFSEDGWLNALRLFAQATRSSRAQLIGIGDGATLFNFMTDIDPCYQSEFLEIEAYRPDVNWRVAAVGRPMKIVSELEYATTRAHMVSDIYDDHCHKWGGMFGAQTTLAEGNDGLIGLAIIRGEEEGKTNTHDRRVFADGAEHALAAVRMQRAMAHRGVQLLTGTLESLGLAAFLLDRDGRVAALTPQADALVSAQDGAVLRLRGGTLEAFRSNSVLRTAIEQALAPTMERSGQVQQIWLDSIREDTSGLRCEVIRLPRREFSFGFDPRVMLVMRSAADLPELALAPLRQALGLTKAEAQIAIRLANGAPRDTIAAERSSSPSTLATQIRSILSKGDVTREAELVALVNRLMR